MNDLFKEIKMTNELHPKFLVLRDVYSEYHREILNEWFDGFVDRDGKFIKEFQTTFHSSFFELFLFKVFKRMGFKFDFTHSRPDFILKHSGLDEIIYVEATTANVSQTGRLETSRGMEDILGMFTCPQLRPDFEVEVNESIIRYASAIKTKAEKYQKDYLNCEWIQGENPYVIALSSYGQVNYGREYIFGILSLLYGKYYSKETNDFTARKSVIKPETGAEILLNIFDMEEYEGVSAILFTSNCTLGKLTALVRSSNSDYNTNHVYNLYQEFFEKDIKFKYQDVSTEAPELVTDGLWVFHNPNAKNKLDVLDFWDEGITQIMIENEKVVMYGNPNPTIARMDLPSLYPKSTVEMMIWGELSDYNKYTKIYFADYYRQLTFTEAQSK